MEVKINREIRNYTESMFFGLSMRQCVFTVLSAGVAILLYFVLKPYVGTETVSWMCILGAAPFAAMGFVTYHGMTAEQFVWAWLRSEVLEPKVIRFQPNNIYYEALKKDSSIGIATVYRMLDTLEEIGILEKRCSYCVNQEKFLACREKEKNK